MNCSNLVESQKTFDYLVNGYDSLIMTSATLTAGGNFSFLKERLGIQDFKERVIGSPFDYKRQSILYLDKTLPAPDIENNDTFFQESLKVVEGLINASMGRALVLFSSYRHLHVIAQ